MLTSLIALSTLGACVEDVGEGKAAAVITEPAPVDEAPAAAPAMQYTVDKAQSKLGALGAKVTAKHPIVFHDFEGTIGVTGDAVQSIGFTVQMATLEADHPKLTKHLLNEDFFHVDMHPTSTFTSTAVNPKADGAWTHEVTGDLTIRGVTKHVTFPATIGTQGSTVQARTEFTIDRQDFEITYPGKKDDLIQDSVVLNIQFSAAAPQG